MQQVCVDIFSVGDRASSFVRGRKIKQGTTCIIETLDELFMAMALPA